MADFNPELGISPTSIQDQTGASRGIPTNRAWETLFSGLGDVAKGAAQTVDVNVQQNIRTDVEQFQDQLNQRMGYGTQASGDQALSTDSVFGGNTAANANPKELQAAKDRMALLTAAHNQGRLTQSMYWDRMTTFAKSLRSQYPGYNQQIDNIIDDVTGRNSPENRLRSELDQQYDKQTSNLQAANKALDTQLYQNAEWITQVNPGFFSPENFNKATTAEKQKVLSQGFELQARDQKLKSDNLQIENEKNTTENKKMKQKDWINQSMNLIAYKSMSQMTSGAGVTGTDLSKKIQQAMINPMSDKDLLSAQTAMQQRKILVMQEMDKLRLTEAGRSMSKSEFDDAKSLAMSDIDFYFDLLNNKETGLMAASANATKLATDRELNSLIEASPLTKRAIAIGKVSPELARSFILGHNTDLLKATDIIAGPATAVGDLKVDDFVKSVMTDKRVTSAEQSQIVTHYTKLFADTFSKKEVSDQNVADMIKTNFDKNGFAELFSTVNASDRYKLYSTLTSPSVTDRISKLADPQAKAMYLDWAKTQFKAIDDVILTTGTMAAAEAGSPNANVQFKYNPQTFTFSVLPPEQNDVIRQNIDPNVIRSQIEAQTLQLSKFNADLSNLGYAMKKLGQDPSVEIPKILNDLHIQARSTGKQSSVPSMQKAVIGSLMPAGGQTPGFTPGDENLHLTQGESANPFIQSTAKNLLDFVAQPESKGNYNAVYGHADSTNDLSTLSLNQVLDYQKLLLKEPMPEGKTASDAIGKYQIIGSTLTKLKSDLGLTGNEPFDKSLQDKLGMKLLVDAGYKEWSSGKISDSQFQDKLAGVWAGLPNSSGKSAYQGQAGNRALVTSEDLLKELKANKVQRKADLATFDNADASNSQAFLIPRSTHGPESVTGLKPVFTNRLASFIQSAPEEFRDKLGIFSGFRSRERQAQLFAASDRSGRMVARPGGSLHESGMAADLAYNGLSLSKAPPEVIQWVKEHAGSFGLKLPMSYEPWHIEPVETRGGPMYEANPFGVASRNDILGGSGKDLLGFGGGTDEDRFPGGQTFAEKDHIVPEPPGPGTFDANQFRESDVPTEDRRLQTTIPGQSSTYRALEKMGIDINSLIRAVQSKPNDVFNIDEFLKDFEANPDKYRTSMTDQEILDSINADTVLLKEDKGSFKQRRK